MNAILWIFLVTLASPLVALPLEGLTDVAGTSPKVDHAKNTELVVFWATWCSTCKEKLTGDLPKLNTRADVAVITVNTDSDVERVKHYITKENITLPVLMDSSRNLRKSLKVFSVPHWAVYKRDVKGKPWNLVDSAPAFEWERIEKALGTPRT